VTDRLPVTDSPPLADGLTASARYDQPGHASIRRPAVVYVALFFAVGTFFPYLSVFYRSVGLTLQGIGLVAALTGFVAVVAAPIWGAAVDRLRDARGPLLIAGLWGAAAAAWLAVSREPVMIAIAAAVLSAGTAGMGSMLDSRTIEIIGSNRDRYGRARAWGSASFVAGALVAGFVLEPTGPAGLFLLYAPGVALAGIAAWLLLGRPVGRGRRTVSIGMGRDLGRLARDPTMLMLFVGSVIVWTSVSAVTTFVSVHLVELGSGTAVVGFVFTPGALVEVPFMLAFPALARRTGPERLLVLGAVAFAARAAGWALVSDPWLYVAIAPLGGVGYALFYVGTVTYVSRVVPPSVQATAQGLFSGTAFAMGAILGSVLGGQVAGALTIPGMFAVAAGSTLVGALVVGRATWPRRTVSVG
jgi:MFS transporter, PPP family, 3-phenylpropionic acid transporter